MGKTTNFETYLINNPWKESFTTLRAIEMILPVDETHQMGAPFYTF